MSTLLNLAGYGNVKHAMFIKLTIPDPDTAGTTDRDYFISNFEIPSTLSGVNYQELGVLLNVTQFQNELRPSANDVSISLSAIPDDSIAQSLTYPIKGAPVEIRRAFFDADTNQLLNITGNPALRYKGIVNNYSFAEEWNDITDTVTWTATLNCSSIISVLNNKVNGRLTNKDSWQYWSALATARGGFNQANVDISMDRVATIATTNWNFGGPVLPGAGTTTGGAGGGTNFESYDYNLN